MKTKVKTISVRLDVTVFKKILKYQAHLSKKLPGTTITISNAVRSLIESAVAKLPEQ